MDGKPKVSPHQTYVLDSDDLAQLDAASFDTLITEALPGLAAPDLASGPVVAAERSGQAGSTGAETEIDELSIDALLREANSVAERGGREDPLDSDSEDTGTHPVIEILVSPEELFSEEDLED